MKPTAAEPITNSSTPDAKLQPRKLKSRLLRRRFLGAAGGGSGGALIRPSTSTRKDRAAMDANIDPVGATRCSERQRPMSPSLACANHRVRQSHRAAYRLMRRPHVSRPRVSRSNIRLPRRGASRSLEAMTRLPLKRPSQRPHTARAALLSRLPHCHSQPTRCDAPIQPTRQDINLARNVAARRLHTATGMGMAGKYTF